MSLFQELATLFKRSLQVGPHAVIRELKEQVGGVLSIPEDLVRHIRAAKKAELRYRRDRSDREALVEALREWEFVFAHPEYESVDQEMQALLLNDAAALDGLCFRSFGQVEFHDRAIERWSRAVALATDGSEVKRMCCENVAIAHRERYRRTSDITDLNDSVALFRTLVKQQSEESPEYAMTLSNFADALADRFERLRDLADLDLAIELYRQAVAMSENNPKTLQAAFTERDAPWRPAFLSGLSTVLRCRFQLNTNEEDLDEARRCAEAAVRLTPPVSPSLPYRLNNVAGMCLTKYFLRGNFDDLKRSFDAAERAVSCCPDKSPLRVECLANLAAVLVEQHANGQRTPLEVRRVFETAVNPVGMSPTAALVAARTWLQWEFEHNSWSDCVRAFESVECLVNELLQIQLIRTARESWARETQGLAAMAAYALCQLERAHDAAAVLERSSARLLTAALRQDRVDLEHLKKSHPDLYQGYVHAAGILSAFDSESLCSDSAGISLDTSDARAARSELETVIEAIRSCPGWKGFLALIALPVLIDERLGDSSACAYLAVTSKGACAVLVTPKSTTSIQLEVTENDVNAWLLGDESNPGCLVAAASPRDAELRHVFSATLERVGMAAVSPIATALRELAVTGVVMIPAGRLSQFPLHAAPYEFDGVTTCLLDQFCVSFAPSLESCAPLRSASSTGQDVRLLAVGNPLTETAVPLPFAESEVRAIALLAGENSVCLIGEMATREAVLGILSSASHLHFACHGTFHIADPLDSSLQLASDDRLTLRDFLSGEASLHATQLVFLSACQSAVTDINRLPDESIGLPAGFLQAGAESVIGTLWPVSDLPTAMMAEKFYFFCLKRKLPPAESLRRAQLWMRDVTVGELRNESNSESSSQLINTAAVRYQLADDSEKPFGACHWASFIIVGRPAGF